MHQIRVRPAFTTGALVLFLTLFVAACGSSDDETTGTTATNAAAKSEPASPREKAAVAQYRDYLEENTAELVAKTKPFVAAVVAGNVAKAKSLYPAARIPYERIEPVAGSFGDLDPRIDAREDGVPADEWGGFHRIEKALWVEDTTKGMAPVAKQLLADVEELEAKVKTVELDPVEIANGANELLAEVSGSKITGEEERYSHIDLVDFEANVEGSEAAFEAVKPLLDESDADLSGEIEADFKMVFNSLQPYRTENGFVSYTELTKADTRKLSIKIDTLAEKLSQVPALIDNNG
jgi:iron uptake system component EfeO